MIKLTKTEVNKLAHLAWIPEDFEREVANEAMKMGVHLKNKTMTLTGDDGIKRPFKDIKGARKAIREIARETVDKL